MVPNFIEPPIAAGAVIPTYHDIQDVYNYAANVKRSAANIYRVHVLGLKSAADYEIVKDVCNVNYHTLKYSIEHDLHDFVARLMEINSIVISTIAYGEFKMLLRVYPEIINSPIPIRTVQNLGQLKELVEYGCQYTPQVLITKIQDSESYDYIKSVCPEIFDFPDELWPQIKNNLDLITDSLVSGCKFCDTFLMLLVKNIDTFELVKDYLDLSTCVDENFLHLTFNEIFEDNKDEDESDKEYAQILDLCYHISEKYPVIFFNLINTKGEYGYTPLHTLYGATTAPEILDEMTSLFINSGYNVNAIDDDGYIFCGIKPETARALSLKIL